MIKTVGIENFRSIENQAVELAPLTFFYGPNASGKSNLFYALNILRNIVLNPNQAVDAFFNLEYVNLGNFKQLIFNHDDQRSMVFSITTKDKVTTATYSVRLSPKSGEFGLVLGKPYDIELKVPATFPYPINNQDQKQVTFNNEQLNVTWTGITAQVIPVNQTPESSKAANELTLLINSLVDEILSIDIVPLKRGFTNPHYGAVSFGKYPIKEEEVAFKLAKDEYLHSSVSMYLEQVMDRQFRVMTDPGTPLSKLQTIEKASRQTMEIVNDGFGVNQLVFLLAKTLNTEAKLVCIEEPEINLHPSIIRKLPRMFLDIVKDKHKQILISTHSENLIASLLTRVAKGEVSKSDISCYFTSKERGVTTYRKQQIAKNGQLSGGMQTFMEGELEDLRSFLGTDESGDENTEPINGTPDPNIPLENNGQ